MEKKIEPAIMGYIGTTIRIHFFIPTVANQRPGVLESIASRVRAFDSSTSCKPCDTSHTRTPVYDIKFLFGPLYTAHRM